MPEVAEVSQLAKSDFVKDFNQVVMKDLKSMGDKYIWWMICSFTNFMLGNLIPNKMADTILEAMNSTWNNTMRYPSIGYFADN